MSKRDNLIFSVTAHETQIMYFCNEDLEYNERKLNFSVKANTKNYEFV